MCNAKVTDMSDFIVTAKKPRYKQPNRNGMMVRVRAQDYVDLAKVCEDANVRLCDLLHGAIRYALEHLKIRYQENGGEDNGNEDNDG